MREKLARAMDPEFWTTASDALMGGNDLNMIPNHAASMRDAVGNNRTRSLKRADAALSALAVPDEGMVEAGRQYLRTHVHEHAINEDAHGTLAAMIEAAKDGT